MPCGYEYTLEKNKNKNQPTEETTCKAQDNKRARYEKPQGWCNNKSKEGRRQERMDKKAAIIQAIMHNGGLEELIRSILIDTGASGTFCWSDVRPYLNNVSKSKSKIEVANGEYIKGQDQGTLSMYVLNLTDNRDIPKVSVLHEQVTTLERKDLTTELMSMSNLYTVKKYSLILRQPEEGISEMYRPAYYGELEARIPLVYDSVSKGWRLYYIPTKYIDESYVSMLTNTVMDEYEKHKQIDHSSFVKSLVDINMMEELICYVLSKGENEISMIRHDSESVYDIAYMTNVKGIKQQLRKGRDKMTYREFHERYGHIGHCPKCVVCILARGNMRRIYSKVAPYRETRPGFSWTMDIIVVTPRSVKGNMYIITLRCVATGVYKLMPLYKRSHAAEKVKNWIRKMRANPLYNTMIGYKVISQIRTDSAGEWEMENQEWNDMAEEMEFMTIWTSPDRKEEAATAESANRVVEVMMRSIMYQNSIPAGRWEWAMDSTEFLLNRFPNNNDDDPRPYDGDEVLPLEKLSRGGKSRRELRGQLESFVMAGTPCLVHKPKVKGSNMGTVKARWGIACSMYDNQVIFYCPHLKTYFRSKSYTEFVLKLGVSYLDFLGLKQEQMTEASKAIPARFQGKDEEVTLYLEGEKSLESIALRGSNRVRIHDSKGIELETNKETGEIEYKNLEDEERGSRKKGPLVVTGPAEKGRTVEEELDEESEEESEEEGEKEKRDREEIQHNTRSGEKGKETNPNTKPRILNNPNVKVPWKEGIDIQSWGEVGDDITIDLATDPIIQIEWEDEIEKESKKDKAVVTTRDEGFVSISKNKHRIPFELIGKYREWLIEQRGMEGGILSMDRKVMMPIGVRLEYPTGSKWREKILENKANPSARWTRLNKGLEMRALNEVGSEVKLNCFRVKNDFNDMLKGIRKAKRKRSKAVGAGQEEPPKNLREAFGHESRGEQWIVSSNAEMKGLTDMGVVAHGLTLEQLKEAGTIGDPINMSIALDHKHNQMGEIERLKTRMAIAGHKGNLQSGIHFDLTYAATPQPNTARILIAIMCLYKWHRKAFDIKMAYCWAALEDGKLLGLKYPEGYERNDPLTGEVLYMLLLKNLYGHPQAARLWARHRDKFVMEFFNVEPYTCHRCVMDPCLFYITMKDEKEVSGRQEALMLIHTDDCDIYSSHESLGNRILEACHEEWECKEVSPDFMLGIKRKVERDEQDNVTCELTMTAFIEGMVETFKEHLPDKKVSTPFPEGQQLFNDQSVSEEEAAQVIELGYMRGCGMVLWAQRHVFPESSVGISNCCRLMAKPSMKAWKYLMHMIAYMHTNKMKGIKFSSRGNQNPIAFSDASNKADPTDGRSQYGYTIMLAGGPIVYVSKKLNHVGHNAFHNEYMAMSECSKAIVWLRQLLVEINKSELIPNPTILYGDNNAAVNLTYENFTSSGNQYIYLAYHYIKEVIKLGYVDAREKRTMYMIADLLTKAVNYSTLNRLGPLLSGYTLIDEEGNMIDEIPVPHRHERNNHTQADLEWCKRK